MTKSLMKRTLAGMTALASAASFAPSMAAFADDDPISVPGFEEPESPYVHVERKEATCDEDGNIEYWYLEEVGEGPEVTTTYYSDAAGQNVISLAQTVIPAGHKINVKFNWFDTQNVIVDINCENGDISERLVAKMTYEVTPPTCEEDGYGVYVASVVFNDVTYSEEYKERDIIPALGHDWMDPTYTWGTNDEGKVICTATRKCKHDSKSDHIISEVAEATSEVTKEAAVGVEGERTYTAVFENEVFATQTKKETIEAIVANYGEATYTWSADHKQMTATRPITNGEEGAAVEATIDTISEVVKEPTCEDPGDTKYTADFSETEYADLFSNQTETVIGDIEPLGHEFGAPTFEWKDDGSVVAVFVCQREDCQTEEQVDAVVEVTEVTKAPTCTDSGLGTLTATVEFEGKTYSESRENVELPATGHDYQVRWYWVNDTKAIAYVSCSHGDLEDYSEVVDAIVERTEPTCYSEGEEVRYCTIEVGDETFKSEEFRTVIPMLDHVYGDPEYIWRTNGDGEMECVAIRKCINCPEGEEDTTEVYATVTYDEPVKPTIDSAGKGVYTATFDDELYTTKTKEIVLSQLTPEYGEAEITWNADYTKATATKTATNGNKTITQTVDVEAAVTKNPTCAEMGQTTYTAVFTEPGIEGEVTEVVDNIEKLPHRYGAPSWVWSLNDDGSYSATLSKTCSVCGDKETYIADVTSVTADGIITFTATANIGEQTYSATIQVTAPVEYKNPEAVQFQAGDGAVKLRWKAAENAQKYGIVVKSGSTWRLALEGTSKVTTCVLEGLKPGQTYEVAVIAMFNGEWLLDYSNAIEVAPKTYEIPEISYVAGDGAVKINWTAAPGAEQYGVVAKVDGNWKLIASGTSKVTSYVIKGLKSGSEYEVAVIAMYSGTWYKNYSNAITVAPKTYENPANVTFEKGNNAVKLSWDAADGAQAYGVAGYVGGKWKLLAEGPATATSYVLKNLKVGTNYKVAVVGKFNGKWNLDFDNAVVVTPLTPYPVAKAEINGRQFKLEWSAVEDANGYGVAVYTEDGWKIVKTVTNDDELSYISKSLDAGTYYVAVCAYKDGKWDTENIKQRAVKIVIGEAEEEAPVEETPAQEAVEA